MNYYIKNMTKVGEVMENSLKKFMVLWWSTQKLQT